MGSLTIIGRIILYWLSGILTDTFIWFGFSDFQDSLDAAKLELAHVPLLQILGSIAILTIVVILTIHDFKELIRFNRK